jgi:hypothetical protein
MIANSYQSSITFNRVIAMDGDVPGHEFHGNQHTGGLSGAAGKASRSAFAKTKSVNSGHGSHAAAARAHEKAAAMHKAAGNKKAAANHKAWAAAHHKAGA